MSNEEIRVNRRMIRQYEQLSDDNSNSSRSIRSYSIDFGKFSCTTVAFPLFSFIFCVAYSLLFYFEQSTNTHCNVKNYLPSISAAIGSRQPQIIIWQLAIILHLLPRFTIIWMYYQSYQRTIRKNRRQLAYLAILLSVIENITLLGLSLYTSTDAYEIHKTCFCTFILTSELYMMLSYYLNKNAKRNPELTDLDRKSLFLKKHLCIANITSILIASYFFVRHNDRCETGIYTLFAFFEYIVVLTNMAFHMCAYYDFHNQHLAYDWTNGLHVHYN